MMKNLSLRPILSTISQQVNAGTVLLASTILALIVANSPFKDLYFSFFEKTYISIDFKLWHIEKPLYYWINDGLMAIFFFLIGLEIKREILIGELSSLRKAVIPLVAALGGIVVPALFFLAFNKSNEEFINGWAIPMATDIAFALGVLAILGKRVPIELKILLTSLAIVDDLVAVLVIATFYTDTINLGFLLFSIGSWIGMLILGRLGFRNLWIFILLGVLFVWYPLLKSGVHATIAGVMVAFTIPLSRKFDAKHFYNQTKEYLESFKNSSENDGKHLLNANQYVAIEEIQTNCLHVTSPLQRLEHSLHSITLYGIMPIFAFANTGIDFSKVEISEVFTSTLSYGIMTGLFLGKVIGITSFIYIAQALKMIELPRILRPSHVIGAGFLAGIGFTMSIFITDLAFHGNSSTDTAKIAILVASLLSGITGYVLLKKTLKIPQN